MPPQEAKQFHEFMTFRIMIKVLSFVKSLFIRYSLNANNLYNNFLP